MGCTAAMPTVATTAKAAAAAAGRMKKKARREDGIKSLSLHVAMLGRRGTLGWEKDTQREKKKKKNRWWCYLYEVLQVRHGVAHTHQGSNK